MGRANSGGENGMDLLYMCAILLRYLLKDFVTGPTGFQMPVRERAMGPKIRKLRPKIRKK